MSEKQKEVKKEEKVKASGQNPDSYSKEQLIAFANYLKNDAITNPYTPINETDVESWKEFEVKKAERLKRETEDREKRLEAVKSGKGNDLVR